mgnify:CR=1 FL=1
MRLETIKIGRIVNAHGIRGEVRVQPDGQDPAFLTRFKTFYLDIENTGIVDHDSDYACHK